MTQQRTGNNFWKVSARSGTTVSKWLGTVFSICLALSFAACATSSSLVYHDFNYNAGADSRRDAAIDTIILAVRYGRPEENGYSRDAATFRPPVRKDTSIRGGLSGRLKVHDTVYVKWKSLADGRVHEETASFGEKLPSDMNDCKIFVTTYGNRLTVYLVTSQSTHGIPVDVSDDMPYEAKYYKTILLYRSK